MSDAQKKNVAWKIFGYPLLLFGIIATAHKIFSLNDATSPPQDEVFLERADVLLFNQERIADAQILVGNVLFRHQTSYMYCDSAYYYENSNSLEAFSNVHMEQGDSIHIFGDYLFYEGDISLARLRNNIRMINNNVTIYTDSLNYDRITRIGYYFNGGKVVDEENTLTSVFGSYSTDTKQAFFKDSVYLQNVKFDLYTDTLSYNTDTKIADIVAPTVIYSDSSVIYTSSGWYDTEQDLSVFLERSVIWNESRSLVGDSIAYDKVSGIGEAFGNAILSDTLRKIIIEGHYLFYDDNQKYALATDSAICCEYSKIDSLFLHADTISYFEQDSLSREIRAYYHARFYRIDLQGVCDSMIYLTADSVLNMHYDPYIWSDIQQITGDNIHIYTNDSTITYAKVENNAFSIEQLPDSGLFNQLRGTYLNAYFNEGEIYRVYVDGNAESIYFPVETDGSYTGVNKTKSSYLAIDIKNNKMQRVVFWPQPSGVMTPLEQSSESDRKFDNFNWNPDLRPKDKNDIFRKPEAAADTAVVRKVNRNKFKEIEED